MIALCSSMAASERRGFISAEPTHSLQPLGGVGTRFVAGLKPRRSKAWPWTAARAAPHAAPADPELRETARRGIAVLMNGDPDGAIEVFRQIQKADPQSPLGYLFEADVSNQPDGLAAPSEPAASSNGLAAEARSGPGPEPKTERAKRWGFPFGMGGPAAPRARRFRPEPGHMRS